MNDRMNQPDQPAPDREELRNRLLDAALRERLGGETPPDLSAAILERAATDASITLSTGEEVMSPSSPHKKRHNWMGYGIAAAVLIGAGLLLLPSVQAPSEAARRTGQVSDSSASTSQPKQSDVFSSQSREKSEPAAATSGYTVDLDLPLRQGSFSAESPQFTAKNSSGAGQQQGEGQAGNPATNRLNDDVRYSMPMEQSEAVATPSTVENEFLAVRETAAAALAHSDDSQQAAVDWSDIPQRSSSAQQPATPANQPGDVYQGSVPLRLWHNTGDTERNTQVAVPTDSSRADAIRLAMLREKLAQLDVALQSKLSRSGTPNSAEIRRLKATAQVINNQIQHLEGQRGFGMGMGMGMGMGRDQYARITENPFLPVSAANTDNRLSTFSIDVDTASYANVRQFLMQSHTLPPPDAVRIEELVNYFDYDYTPPTGDVPFAANVEVAGCPWAPEHRLVRVGIKGREIERTGRPLSNLVFLIDVSGSMNEPNKLPLLVAGMKQLTRQLGENDRVAIVVYASSEGLALDSTPGTDQSKILAALDQLQAGGSTAGGAGIQLAYQVAQQNFIKGAVNRVILCTDGDFNVGVTSPADLERMAETNAKETGVFLTVLGFGRGNLNDAMMEQVADKGNGNYHYIDTDREAQKVLVEEMTGTLVTIAKDVKIQVEFNPAKVAGYRLIGYENRVLAAEDFNDDKKDAGEIGAGHTVTALYEIVPVGQPVAATAVDELKYAPKLSDETKPAGKGAASDEVAAAEEPASDELLTLKIRYKAPDGDQSTKLEFPIVDNGQTFAAASQDFKFASAVASFGMLLRNSEFKGNATYAAVAEIAAASQGNDPHEYRQEFVDMVERAKQLTGE